jgi:DNA modification methylase
LNNPDYKAHDLQDWPTDRLIEYARNPRKNDHAVDRVASAIREFGFKVPIVARSDGTLVDGHLRLKAAKKLGMDTVPVLLADDLTDAQVKAFRISVNRMAELAEWDDELLRVEFEELDAMGFDLELTGFGEDDLASMFPPEPTEGLTDEDAVPEVPEQPVTVEGDVWLLGRHRLMCGDSTSIDAVERLMDGRKADMVFTDPPYGVEFQSNMRTKSAKFDVLKNDDTFLDIAPIIEACSTGWVFVWTSWKVQTKWIDQFQSMGYPTNIVVWHKPGGGIGDLKRTFSSDYEVALVWHRGAELCGKRIGSVWTVNKDGASTYVHPTQKPVALAEEALDKTTRASAVIMDLFGGSGSTLIACEKTARDCRMMELDPKYCDVIIKRWQDFTGQQATLEGDGRTFAEVSGAREANHAP